MLFQWYLAAVLNNAHHTEYGMILEGPPRKPWHASVAIASAMHRGANWETSESALGPGGV